MSKSKSIEVVYQSGDDLASLLRSIIDGSGLTRYAIAKQAGIAESTLSRMYTGSRPATMETLNAVAMAIGRSVVVRVE